MAASRKLDFFALTMNRGLAPRFLFSRRSRWAPFPAAILIPLLFAACHSREVAPQPPRRIVTLAPNVTEMVYAVGEGRRLVGTDDSSDFPPAARSLPKVGGVQPDVERITALRPDLVIGNAAGLPSNLGPALKAVGIPLLIVRNERLRDIAASMRTIGVAIGARGAAAAADAVEQQLRTQQRTRAHPPRIMLAVWTDPLYVAGAGSFADDLFTLAGVRNAVEVGGWPQYPLEVFVAAPPDILLLPNRSVTPAQVSTLLQRSHVSTTVVSVDENVFTRPGPRVAEAAAALNGIADQWEKRPIVRRSPPG